MKSSIFINIGDIIYIDINSLLFCSQIVAWPNYVFLITPIKLMSIIIKY